MFSLIVCTDTNGCIGIARHQQYELAFNYKDDMKNFKNKTTNNVVIMGRKTWESLPAKSRPLPNRINIIISTSLEREGETKDTKVLVFKTIEECLIELTVPKSGGGNRKKYKGKELFVIGGATLYDYFLKRRLINKLYISISNSMAPGYDGDSIISEELYKFVHDRGDQWKIISGYQQPLYTYYEYQFVNREELQVLDTMRTILASGYTKSDRTGTGTLSIFCPREMRFDISDGKFPLATSRSMTPRLIFEELMFFLRGQTNNQILVDKKVPIWIPNTTREFLDSRGLHHYEPGDMGPTYSFLFRYFGAEYKDCNTDYTNAGGFDQLAYVIDLLKNNPDSRRIMINLWNPRDFDKMSLPPCAFCYQFYVTPARELITRVTQRSSDIGTAGFWNISSATLLTYMLARVCGLTPKELIWSPADTHIYLNLVESVREQLTRDPRNFPNLIVKPDAPSLENGRDITEFEFTDFQIVNYDPHPAIKFIMNP
jgi:thymidylate synthase